MNSFDLKKLKNDIEQSENNILFTKGTEYALSQTDRLAFFREYSEKLGVDSKMVCAIFLMKHINSILNYVKTGKESTEGIKGRIMDARNYLLFMEALIEDDKDLEKVGGTSDDTDTQAEPKKDDYYTFQVTAKCIPVADPVTICSGGEHCDYSQLHNKPSLDKRTLDEVKSQKIEDEGDWEVFEDTTSDGTEFIDGDD